MRAHPEPLTTSATKSITCVKNSPTTPRFVRKALSWILPGEFPTTTLLLILNLGVYVLLAVQSGTVHTLDSFILFRAGANFGPYAIQGGEPWRLLTYNVLHHDLLHIALNGYGLWQLGRILEKRMGTGRLMTLYLLAGLGGGLMSALLTKGFAVGASGALYGWLAALGVYAHYAGLKQVRNRVVVAGASVYVLAFALGGTGVRFDNWAHTGGAIVGGLFAWVLVSHEKRLRRSLRRSTLPFALAGTLAFLTLAIAPFAVQYRFKDVPPVTSEQTSERRQVQLDAWETCRDAIGEEPTTDAIAPCRDFRLATWDISPGYLLLHALYGALDMDDRAVAEARLYEILFDDDLSDSNLLPPDAMLPILVQDIDEVIHHPPEEDD